MANSIKSQSIIRNICTRKSLIASCVLAGFLTPVLNYSLVKAQDRGFDLPPNAESQPFPSPTQGGYLGRPLPQQNSGYDFQAPPQTQIFQQNYQQPLRYSQRNQGYFVYVDGTDWRFRDIIARVENGRIPTVNYRGRNVFQAGYFSREQNARNRQRELVRAGIPRERIIISLGENQIPDNGGNWGDWPGQSTDGRNRDAYYVIIPGNSDNELIRIQQTIRRNAGSSLNGIEVRRRNHPRGPHVAVGPFPQRLSAQQWNDYIRGTLNLGNARVYYGR
jgi:hypothetical protein